jgi:hypothetical protein
MMSLNSALWLAGIVTEAAVLGLLLYRRVWRLLPVFCVYCAWDIVSNVGAYAGNHFFPGSYLKTYLVETAVDSALQFAVLVELAWSVLRPLRASLPRKSLVVVGVLILAVGAAIWPFAGNPGLAQFSKEIQLILQLQQTVSILRILFFLLLAGCSHLLSIGLRDRELQVATGLGFYSLVSLVAAMLQTHQSTGLQYMHLNQIVVVSFLISLLYWVFSFAQKEAERREFTPQMQSFLLAVAGTARSARVAMTESSVTETRGRRKL